MDIAVYDTGNNYLVAELYEGNPWRGLLADKEGGTLEGDTLSLDGTPRMGAMRTAPVDTARLAASGRFLAEFRDGKLKRYSADAESSEEFWDYARVEPEF